MGMFNETVLMGWIGGRVYLSIRIPGTGATVTHQRLRNPASLTGWTINMAGHCARSIKAAGWHTCVFSMTLPPR